VKILCVFGKHQYGRPALGIGIEYAAFKSALRRLGHEVVHFESWNRSIYRDYAELNQNLLECATGERPDVLLAVQRDCEIWTETLDEIRERGITTISWTTDDSWKYREVSRFIGHHYDLITTTYDYAVPQYHRDGIQHVFLTQWAANVESLQPPRRATECRYDISFVGAAYGARREMIAALKARGVAVECFGDGWPGGPVSAEEIPHIMNNSRVSLNFSDAFKQKARRQIKARTFEVPGAGGLLLTEYARGLENFYKLGVEILSYKSIDEMEAQIRCLHANPSQRDSIALAGYLRTKSDHTYDLRLSQILDAALDPGRRREHPPASGAFADALKRYRGRFALKPLGQLMTSACSPIWGAERGQRAARRALFELSWRMLGKKTFAAEGLPGRLFPQI
jgi:spore maturation protein CgeB